MAKAGDSAESVNPRWAEEPFALVHSMRSIKEMALDKYVWSYSSVVAGEKSREKNITTTVTMCIITRGLIKALIKNKELQHELLKGAGLEEK